MLRIRSNKFIRCFHTDPWELGLSYIIPIVILGEDHTTIDSVKKIIQTEYSEHFIIVEIGQIHTSDISDDISDLNKYNLNVISIETKRIKLAVSNSSEIEFYNYTGEDDLEKLIARLCYKVIKHYRAIRKIPKS